jgi:hypothetical protein
MDDAYMAVAYSRAEILTGFPAIGNQPAGEVSFTLLTRDSEDFWGINA